MVEVEELELSTLVTPRKRLEWFFSILVKPAKTIKEIASEDRAAWLLPLLVLTVLTLAIVLVSGPLRQQAILNAPPVLPPSFEYMTPEQQQQYLQAQASAAGDTQIYMFPMIGAATSLWVSWFVLGGILHLLLTMFGSRTNNTFAFNLAAWASVPFVIRLLVQIVAVLTARQLITSPGLSGFIAADASGAAGFFRIVLSMVDLYLIWQVIILVIGAATITGLKYSKALAAVLISMVILLALAALPGFIASQINGMNVGRPFIFF
jgi:hypothetical protein